VRRVLAGMLIGATVLVGCAGRGAEQPMLSPSRCYEATGHTVRGEFLRAFDAWGGVRSLGYPITEAFEQSGRLVQYFTYARLEDHPDNPAGPMVKLGMLGEDMGRRQPPIDARRVPPALEPTTRYYPESGHVVRGDFLRFIEANGGVERFGFPIGEPIVVAGHLVQDFQHLRLVWQPGAQQAVTMEESGCVYFQTRRLDPSLLSAQVCQPDADVVPAGE